MTLRYTGTICMTGAALCPPGGQIDYPWSVAEHLGTAAFQGGLAPCKIATSLFCTLNAIHERWVSWLHIARRARCRHGGCRDKRYAVPQHPSEARGKTIKPRHYDEVLCNSLKLYNYINLSCDFVIVATVLAQ